MTDIRRRRRSAGKDAHHGDHGTKQAQLSDRRSCTPDSRSGDRLRCRAGDRTIPKVARGFDLTVSAVRRLVAQAEVNAGERPGMSTEEREELSSAASARADVDLA